MVTLGGQQWYWACDVVCTHAELLTGLACLAHPERQIILEGFTHEVAKRLAPLSERPLAEVESGFIWFGKPKLIAMRMSPETMNLLHQVVQDQAGPEVLIHCMIVAAEEVLMEAYDAGDGVVHFSPLCPASEIEAFARSMNVKIRREEVP
jgi:hypothetical protein